MEEQIAKIESTDLGPEHYWEFAVNISFSYGAGGGQGTGFLNISGPKGAEFLRRLLWACGTDRWEKLVGRTVYVLRDEQGFIRGVKPLPTEPGREFIFETINAYTVPAQEAP